MNTTKLKPSIAYAIVVSMPNFLIAFLIMAVLATFDESGDIRALTMPVGAVWFLYKFLLVRSNTFIIGKEKIVHKSGLFSITTEFLEMYRIRDFKIEQPFLLRLIKSMVVTLRTTDKYNPIVKMSGVLNSDIVYKIRDLVELQRKNKNVYVTE